MYVFNRAYPQNSEDNSKRKMSCETGLSGQDIDHQYPSGVCVSLQTYQLSVTPTLYVPYTIVLTMAL